MAKNPEISIVGAGMGGCLMSIYLAQNGQDVDLLERRPDIRGAAVHGGRSINLTLATRAIAALDELGIKQRFLDLTVPLKGRMIHRQDGAREFQSYGNSENEILYSITRHRLNCALLDAVQDHPGVNLKFNTACMGLDKENRRLLLRDEVSQEVWEKRPDVVIGADGSFSAVRRAMHKNEMANESREFLDWRYKELVIPPGPGGRHVLEGDVLHVWPRGANGLLLAMPNPDGSFTGTLIVPFDGALSRGELLEFFHQEFPDAVDVISDLARSLAEATAAGSLTLQTDPWYYKDWVVLLGDACHTVLPFYGQGMNAAFEDCSYLAKRLMDGGDREKMFQGYQRERKRNTDVLAALSKQNFVELRDSVRSPLIGYRKKTDLLLNRCMPRTWVPLYTMVSHSTMPYADAVAKAEKQQRILRWTGVDLVLRSASAATTAAQAVRALKPPRGREPAPKAATAAAAESGTGLTLVRFLMGLSLWTIVLAGVAGLLTGGSRAALLAVINSALTQGPVGSRRHLAIFAGLAGLMLVSHLASRLLLIRLSQGVILNLRSKLSREILAAPLRRVEEAGTPRLLSALTDDVGTLAGALLALPDVLVHVGTLLVCLVYLGWLSLPALATLLGFMALGALSYQAIVARAMSRMRRAREDQNRLFGHFRAVTDGIKELKLNARRKQAFLQESLGATATSYHDNHIAGRSTYALAGSWGQFLFFGYIGLLLFLIAGVQSMDRETLTGYTLIVLYIIVPLEMLLMVSPQLANASVAVENIRRIGLSLHSPARDESEETPAEPGPRRPWRTLELDHVSRRYSPNGNGFQLGPVTIDFAPGDLVFLMGGNGSGKSTLAKVLTGLYPPDAGEIRLDGERVHDGNRDRFRQMFSAVFANYHLFDTLEGLDSPGLRGRLRTLLQRLQLDHVVEIKDGRFSTTDLSTGQRKRLALLVAFAEDRDFYVFDEWAADQDPEFKKVFYTELLPEMKAQGKTVLVITHDEKYTHVADRLVRLDDGKLSEDGRRPRLNLEGMPMLETTPNEAKLA